MASGKAKANPTVLHQIAHLATIPMSSLVLTTKPPTITASNQAPKNKHSGLLLPNLSIIFPNYNELCLNENILSPTFGPDIFGQKFCLHPAGPPTLLSVGPRPPST